MKKNDKIGFLVVLGLIILFLGYDFVFTKLMRGGEIISGKIIDYGPGNKGTSISIKYEYYIDGKTYTSATGYGGIAYADGSNFINRNVPLIYSRKISSVRLLLLPNDFKKYDVPFPDSMQWVLNYFRP